MKKIILIFISFLPLISQGQSKLDSILFQKINEYRVSKGVPKCELDSTCFKESYLQSSFISKNNKVGHQNPIGNSKQRYIKMGGRPESNTAEVCSNIKPLNIKNGDSLIYDKIANKVLEAFKNSKLHNEAILDPQYKYNGVSTVVVISECGIKNYLNYQVFAVIFFSTIN